MTIGSRARCGWSVDKRKTQGSGPGYNRWGQDSGGTDYVSDTGTRGIGLGRDSDQMQLSVSWDNNKLTGLVDWENRLACEICGEVPGFFAHVVDCRARAILVGKFDHSLRNVTSHFFMNLRHPWVVHHLISFSAVPARRGWTRQSPSWYQATWRSSQDPWRQRTRMSKTRGLQRVGST